jgi:[acyl-carrier-protein] S-malonyltransferase
MSETSYLFAGQGAQAVGMGRDLADAFPACRGLFAKAGDVLGFDLAKVCFEGPAEELTKSNRAQPAIFVTSVACLEGYKARGGAAPAAAAGLSSGEWSALYAAGALSFEDTLRVLQARGQFMQQACEQNPGTMLSVIGLELPAIEDLARRSGAEVANLNSPGQTVLSGTHEAIAAAEVLAREAKARMAVKLNVAGAFHSSLMKPAADQLKDFLAGIAFKAPEFPVLSNVTGQPHTTPDAIRDLMARQVTGSVRWVDCMGWMLGQGVRQFVEFGPGKVLAGLMKRIDKTASVHTISDLSGLPPV